MIKIYVWSDGTWCHARDIGEYGWMSDDYITLWITSSAGEDDIEIAVNNFIKSSANKFLIEPEIAEPTPQAEMEYVPRSGPGDEMSTCYNCQYNTTCKFAWDEYNLDGSCIMEK
jgi:hypothetical protein